jgi:hypothetical protein
VCLSTHRKVAAQLNTKNDKTIAEPARRFGRSSSTSSSLRALLPKAFRAFPQHEGGVTSESSMMCSFHLAQAAGWLCQACLDGRPRLSSLELPT